METLRVVFRNSRLSSIQVEEIKEKLPELSIRKIPVLSYGDKHKEISLHEPVRPDFFTFELDQALLNNEADIAIHSAKDLPYPLPDGLEVVALTERQFPEDALVTAQGHKLFEMPP